MFAHDKTQNCQFTTHNHSLTRRELEILTMIASGATDHQIADTIRIGERTVRCHIENICQKLKARNRTHAVYLATKLTFI